MLPWGELGLEQQGRTEEILAGQGGDLPWGTVGWFVGWGWEQDTQCQLLQRPDMVVWQGREQDVLLGAGEMGSILLVWV